MKALDQSLTSALQSREQRAIRRRLPQPPPSPPPIDFSSNDYLSLATSPSLRDAFLRAAAAAPHGELLGSGGSRLLVPQRAHAALEARLAKFFDAPSALLFNSGFDANAGLFACVPQAGDAVILDELIHASVHDGVRASRVRDAQYNFANNDVRSFKHACERVLRDRPGAVDGKSSVFVAVESVYSMDGTFAPLKEIVDLLEHYFPCGNAYLIVDEAHATGIYGPNGAGRVAELGLQHRVFARLHTFGKALAGTGAILLVPPLVRDYLVNYARPLIYTTALSYANVIAANCSFDMLENGSASKLSERLLSLSSRFLSLLRPHLYSIHPSLLSLPPELMTSNLGPNPPSPIIPVLTAQPRKLSAYLLDRGLDARPITWPTVPKGKDRVRVCLHAGNTREEVVALVDAMIAWARAEMDSPAASSSIKKPLTVRDDDTWGSREGSIQAKARL